jgi:tRNA A-37 threonylcarbamoyl transferase component Bud32
MSREYRVTTALGRTDVPVPRTFALCTDESVIVQAFYVMEHVEGHVLRDRASVAAVLDLAGRRVSQVTGQRIEVSSGDHSGLQHGEALMSHGNDVRRTAPVLEQHTHQMLALRDRPEVGAL